MSRYQMQYQGILVDLKRASVHVHNDAHLLHYLRNEDPTARSLAATILAEYRQRLGDALAISQDSLAIEILCHVFTDKVAESIDAILEKIAPDSKGPLSRLMDKIEKHVEVIDCGEAAVDSNRFVWDALVPVRSIVYALAAR